MKILLIYNPFSGNGSFKDSLDYIIETAQSRGFHLIPYRITPNQTLDTFLATLDLTTFNRIWVAGGDGTIHQAVNALLRRNCNLPIGIYPVGTANDFARYFNFPTTVEEMTEILLRDNYTYCDLGVANDHYFLNVASFGFLVAVGQKTDKRAKNTLGVLAYYLKGIEELTNLTPLKISIQSQELTQTEEIYFMLIMNGRSAGGFKNVAPLASLSDNLLDVFIFKACPILDLLPLVIKVSNGEHTDSPYVTYFQTSQLTIDCEHPIGTDMDGEKGFSFPVTIKISPKKLKLLTLTNQEEGHTEKSSFTFYDVKKAVEQISNGVLSEVTRPFKEVLLDRNTVTDMFQLATDMPRHNSLTYINKNTLNDKYFEVAESSLNNGYLYIILSSTGSAAGELIQKVTKKEYAHASLAFDEELRTIVSYNGGENIYAPGLNQELLEFFSKKPDANVIIYKIKADKHQKQKALEEIKKINQEGSSYNVLGLFLPYSHRQNIMFCSQFVYHILKVANLTYFDKKPEDVKPTDFVELDYKRNLAYHAQLFAKQ